jgi:CBS domain-containing protein
MTKTVITAREADTVDQLTTEMTTRRFRHVPVLERDRLIGLVSIGDLVKIQIAEIEMEAAATREYTGLGGLSNTKRNLHNETIARI